MNSVAPQNRDPHFAAADPVLHRIWDDLQRWQTEFCFAHEMAAYYSSESWIRAQTVLDIGTGNGYYLRKMIQLFPGKKYVGIDSNRVFINTAREETAGLPVEFQQSTVLDWQGEYDFCLLRLVLQHLPDVGKVLEHVGRLTRKGGSVLIVDAADSRRFFYPRLPEFVDFFDAFRRHEAEMGRNRDVACELAQYIEGQSTWKMGSQYQVLIPSSLPGNLQLFRKTYSRVLDMLERAGELKYDFAAVRTAWNRWCDGSSAFTQVGLTLVRLDRT